MSQALLDPVWRKSHAMLDSHWHESQAMLDPLNRESQRDFHMRMLLATHAWHVSPADSHFFLCEDSHTGETTGTPGLSVAVYDIKLIKYPRYCIAQAWKLLPK